MACSDYDDMAEPLRNFTADAPADAVICPFASDMGAGMGMPVFAMFVFGFVGLGLTVRTQHPGPIMVAGMLSASFVAASLPGTVSKVFAVVLFFGIAGVSLYIYQRAKSSL